MRISDWSSDVCSSDLRGRVELRPPVEEVRHHPRENQHQRHHQDLDEDEGHRAPVDLAGGDLAGQLAGDLVDIVMDRRHTAQEEQREAERRMHRSEEHTSELQSLMRISYAVFCLKTKKQKPHKLSTKTY